jgi:HEAT repeat protein
MKRLNQLLKAMHSEDVDEAVGASTALNAEATVEWLPALRELLTTGGDFFVRDAAAWPVARLDGFRALPLLLRAHRLGTQDGHDNDGLDTVIIEVIEAHPSDAVPSLLEWAGSGSDADRTEAAWLLGFVHIPPHSLLGLAKDQSPSVRSAAFGSLASFKGDEAVYSALVAGLSDESDDVAVSAASALGYYGDRRASNAVSALRDRVSSRHHHLLDYSLQLLTAVHP